MKQCVRSWFIINNIDEIRKLKNLFQQLLNLISGPGKGQIDHQLNEINRAIAILNNYITNLDNDYDEVITEIKSIRRDLYPPREGLSDFYIWKDNEDERIAINKPISEISNKIWDMLKN